MVGWYHRLNGHEFEQTPGDSEGQGSWVCCSPWGHRVGYNWVTGQQHEDSYRWKPNYRWETLRRLEGEIRKAFWKRNWLSQSIWRMTHGRLGQLFTAGKTDKGRIFVSPMICVRDREWSLCCWTMYTLGNHMCCSLKYPSGLPYGPVVKMLHTQCSQRGPRFNPWSEN